VAAAAESVEARDAGSGGIGTPGSGIGSDSITPSGSSRPGSASSGALDGPAAAGGRRFKTRNPDEVVSRTRG
jgi:hypothetical protein